jgi:PAP2 superfamily
MKTNYLIICALTIGLLLTNACSSDKKDYTVSAANPEFVHQSVKRLTDVIIHDIFNPPVSSRIYTYSSVAGYEALLPAYPDYPSMAGKLTGFTATPKPENGKTYCFPLASIQAFLSVAKALTFSEDTVENVRKEMHAKFKELGVPEDVFNNSLEYGNAVSKHVLDWAAKDNYKQSRTFPKYTVITSDSGSWQPTPPAYTEALEPNWSKIRPFTMDSAAQFKAAPVPVFSSKKESDFYKLAQEVVQAQANLTEDQKNIALFWDDNAMISHVQGHVSFATKKMTPGGHWMAISSVAARKNKADMMKSMQTYMLVGLGLADGFINCWTEKYRSRLIRPETYINRYINRDWKPLLQTPPFPEYTSGHSTISAASATILTRLYGESFSFTDSTEVGYIDTPPRSFQSFRQAADEASTSRLYGGIHYTSGLVNGVDQGNKVGNWVLEKCLPKSVEQK